MKDHISHLFRQAILVSEKLIRVAILCDEQWHEGLEDALRSIRRAHVYFGIVLHPPSLPSSLLPSLPFPPSLPTRMYFGEHNVKAMLSILEPLHLRMKRRTETLKETSFNYVSTFHCKFQGGKISKTNHPITKLQLLGEALLHVIVPTSRP